MPDRAENNRDLRMKAIVGAENDLTWTIGLREKGRASQLRGKIAISPEQSKVATEKAEGSNVASEPGMRNAETSDPTFAVRIRDSSTKLSLPRVNNSSEIEARQSLAAEYHQSTKTALIHKRKRHNGGNYQITEIRDVISLVDAPAPDRQQYKDHRQRSSEPLMDGNHRGR